MRESPEDYKRRQREELDTITGLLRDRVEDLAPVLLPEGRREGTDWRAGSRGGRSIRLSGPYKGVYRDFESGNKGCDMLQAITDILCHGSLRDGIAWARSFLGMDNMNDEALALARRKAAERRAQDAKKAKALDAKRRRQANGLWQAGQPLEGSPADAFLMGRGIDIRKLKRMPSALRFNPETWCKERRGQFPAMVSGLWRQGEPDLAATHRTYLAETADGWGKAPVQSARSILGSWPGAVIPIQRGETDKRWRDIEEGETVAFGEGIEEALTVALVKPEWRVGAVGFVGNFGQVKLPVWCHVMLCINRDPIGSEAHKAIYGDPDTGRAGAIAELEAAGHLVSALLPPEGFKDWNALLMGQGA